MCRCLLQRDEDGTCKLIVYKPKQQPGNMQTLPRERDRHPLNCEAGRPPRAVQNSFILRLFPVSHHTLHRLADDTAVRPFALIDPGNAKCTLCLSPKREYPTPPTGPTLVYTSVVKSRCMPYIGHNTLGRTLTRHDLT
jgi:hypothetical protein